MAIGTLLVAAATAVFASAASAQDDAVELVSTGPTAGTGPVAPGSYLKTAATSADGARVIFTTFERLVSADTDDSLDLYERSGRETTLLSIGPTGGNAPAYANFAGASADATHVFFNTSERLVAGDTDDLADIYERFNGQTKLLSIGPTGGNGNDWDYHNALFEHATADGARVFFSTEERLTADDVGGGADVYESFGGQTALVTTSDFLEEPHNTAGFAGASPDGSRVFFYTKRQMSPADTDAEEDVYERSGGQTTLVSTGPAGGNTALEDAYFSGTSAGGTRVYFSTWERLVAADTDQHVDVYERSGGQTTLVSVPSDDAGPSFDAGRFGASADGARVFFVTKQQMVAADTDEVQDLYERSGGQTTLLSTGPTGGNGNYYTADSRGVSPDGERVFFVTEERLVSGDTDSASDVYQRSGGQTTLLSAPPAGSGGAFNAFFLDASTDGRRVFFETFEPLVAEDTDAYSDVYQRLGDAVTLVTPMTGGLFDTRVSAEGSRVFFNTADALVSDDTDADDDIYAMPTTRQPAAAREGEQGGGGRQDSAPQTPIARRGDRRADDGVPPTPRALAGAAPSVIAALLSGGCANVRMGSKRADALTGTTFGDSLRGRDGNDVLAGRAGDDCLFGGAGNDVLTGGTGRDTFHAGSGNDRVDARDGRRELVDCGRGTNDRVIADRNDRLVRCEQIRRR